MYISRIRIIQMRDRLDLVSNHYRHLRSFGLASSAVILKSNVNWLRYVKQKSEWTLTLAKKNACILHQGPGTGHFFGTTLFSARTFNGKTLDEILSTRPRTLSLSAGPCGRKRTR